MKKELFINVFTVFIVFIVITAIGISLEKTAFIKYISINNLGTAVPSDSPHKSYYWDLNNYAIMAINAQCIAFYPLWSWLIKNLFHPQNIDEAAYYLRFSSLTLFLISIPLLFILLDRILKNQKLSLVISLIFTVNPFSIFRVIGYTESLFTFLSLLLFFLIFNEVKLINLLLISIIVILLSLTRPILIQFIFASTITSLTLIVLEKSQSFSFSYPQFIVLLKEKGNQIKLTLTIISSSLIGYSIYGIFCLETRHNFFAPFADQKLWNKQLGFHPGLLILPKSLLYDLWGLYFPVFLIILAYLFIINNYNKNLKLWIPKSNIWYILLIYPPLFVMIYIYKQLTTDKDKQYSKLLKIKGYKFYLKTKNNYLFWFCSYFSLSQAMIVFFSQDRLHSLARYIFAIPFFFISLGIILSCLLNKKSDYKPLWFTLVILAITLIKQWMKYGQNSWIG